MTPGLFWAVVIIVMTVARCCLAWLYHKSSSGKARDSGYWRMTNYAPVFGMVGVAVYYLFFADMSVPSDFEVGVDLDPGPASFATAVAWGLVYPLLYLGAAWPMSEWIMRQLSKP
jgi:NhaP-type Na+/H+ or K+/H+ antiporter